jgi:hypothetical protein
VAHADPNPVYHRDIRETNIMKKFDGSGWFLIDWTDATTTPTHGITHLTESEHSPQIRVDNHGAEVDIWGIARYMKYLASRAACRVAKPEAVKEMAKRWMEDVTTSAANALDELEVRIYCLIIRIMD